MLLLAALVLGLALLQSCAALVLALALKSVL
jgi:hypothetical protein